MAVWLSLPKVIVCSFFVKLGSDFAGYNYAGLILDIVKAIVILYITKVLVERLIKVIKSAKNLSEYGIVRIKHHDSEDNRSDSDKGSGNLSRSDISLLFGRHNNPKPYEICLFFITGYTFFDVFIRQEKDITELARNGCKVKILVGNHKQCRFAKTIGDENYLSEATEYYYKIASGEIDGDCFLDRSTAMVACKSSFIKGNPSMKEKIRDLLQTRRGDHLSQILKLNALVKEANEQNGNDNIEIRYYTDEYKFPITIAKYECKKEKDVETRIWSNFATPIQEVRKSIGIYGEAKKDDSTTFASSSVLSFDYIWNRYENTSFTR